MKNGKYESAVMNLVPSSPKEWTPVHIDILTAAATIDRLKDDIIGDSRRMAEKFNSYATEVETRGDGWSPMGYSTLRDLDVNVAKLEVHKEYFRTLMRSHFGLEVTKAFFQNLYA